MVPIISLRESLKSEGGLISDTSSLISECDVDRLYDTYHIPRETFCVFSLSPHIHVSDLIPAEDTIMVFEKQLKAGLRFPIDLFFVDVLRFHKLSIAQLHPNS